MHSKLYKNMFKLTFILFTLLLLCCKEADTKAIFWDTVTSITITDLVSLLGKSVDSLPDINGYEKEKKEIKDTFEWKIGGTDGYKEWTVSKDTFIYTFFRVEYKRQNKLIFVVESDIFKTEHDGRVLENIINWDSLMNKITLFSDEIKEGDVYVGQTFGNVRNLVKDKFLVTGLDLVFAILDEYPGITIGFDVSKIRFESKYRKISSIMDIPDSAKIQSIEIINRQDFVLLPDEVKSIELSNISNNDLWGDVNIPLDSHKKTSFLEDLNKSRFSKIERVPRNPHSLCYEIKICCKNNEEISLEQWASPYYMDFKNKVSYISSGNLVTRYWDLSKYEDDCHYNYYERLIEAKGKF